jgi:hypothetical protein
MVKHKAKAAHCDRSLEYAQEQLSAHSQGQSNER